MKNKVRITAGYTYDRLFGYAPPIGVMNIRRFMGALQTTRTVRALLDRRTGNVAIRAEHTAIAVLRLQPCAAFLAVIKELSRVGRHGFNDPMVAFGAGQR